MAKPASLPPTPKTEPHWQTFELPLQIGSGRSFISGEAGIRMAFYQNSKDKSLIGRVWFGEKAAGPPQHVHGGVSAYVLDEAMGSASWLMGYAVVAASFDLDFLNMTPLGVDLLIEAKVKRVRGHDVYLEAEIKDDSGKTYTTARGRFHRLPKAKVQQFFLSQGLDIADFNLTFIE